ncbi:MAG: oligosaccharide flippase family protein [Bacteroidia bacterium]|nr:oligosaccharide flippase family protein [Bacteroidia bacterium]
MNPIKKLASQTAVYGISQIAGRFINYLLVPLHTALFSTAEYGVNNLMYSYVTFFNVLLTYGMETAFFRYAQKNENSKDVYTTALTSLLGTGFVFAIGITTLSSSIAALAGVGSFPSYITYFAWIIAIDAICSLPFAYLRKEGKALRFALIKNINIFTNILLNLYFLLLCPYIQQTYGMLLPLYEGKVEVGYIFMANLIASLITVPLLAKEFLAIREGTFNKDTWRSLLNYGLPLMFIGFAGMINETLDRVILTFYYEDTQKGLEATGIYGANYKLAILMTLFIQAFRYAAEPFFFNHAAKHDKREIYATVMNWFVLVCLVLFLSVTFYIDVFKYFIADESYWVGLKIVPTLLLANMFLGMYYNFSIWYKLSDQTKKGAVIAMIGAGITIAGNLILIPLFGYEGSAWATLICYFSMAVMCWIQGIKYYPIPYDIWRICKYILIALALFVINQKWLTIDGTAGYVAKGVIIATFIGITATYEFKKGKVV